MARHAGSSLALGDLFGFDGRRRTQSVFFVILAAGATALFFASFEDLLYGWVETPWQKPILPFFLMCALWGLAWWQREQNRRLRILQARVDRPVPSPCLVVFLSSYWEGKRLPALTAAELKATFEGATTLEAAHRDEMLTKLYNSNWGPMLAAVAWHAESGTLRHCYVVGTADVTGPWTRYAEGVIRTLYPDVRVHRETIPNSHDVEDIAESLDELYERIVTETKHEESEIVGDMTSGTKSMSAGLVLATLDPARRLQYLRQGDKRFQLVQDGIAVPARQLVEGGVLVEVNTGGARYTLRRPETEPA
ncbi:MAG: hypothetical protein AAF752_06745 [Bacteroidota bacterium]